MVQRISAEEYQKRFGENPFSVPEETQSKATRGFAVGLATGAVKSLASTVLGAGQIGRGIQSGISRGVDATFGTEGFGVGGESIFDHERANEIRETTLAREQPGEGVGGFIGDVAQFAIPGTAVARATRGAGALARVGSQAASDATVTTVGQGGVDRSTLDSAIIGALIPGISEARRVIGPRAGERLINSLIKPLKKDFSFGKNPGRAVAQMGITGRNFEDLTTNIGQTRNQVGQEISQKIQTFTGRFTIDNALNPIDDAITSAQNAPRTNQAVIQRLQNLRDDLLRVGEDGLPQTRLQDLTAPEVFSFKQQVADLTRWTGNQSDDQIANKAMQGVYRNLKRELDVIPGLRPLNERYADLNSAFNAAQYRHIIAERQGLISLIGTNLGVGAGIGTAIATGSIGPAVIIGAGAQGLRSALGSTAAKTNMARWLAQTPPETLQQTWREAPWARSVIQAALFGEESVEADQNEQ